MEGNLDRPIAEWSDDHLLEQYRSPTTDLPVRVDKAAIAEEILRRGLPFPDASTVPKSESVDWSGEAGGEDPGSGALPTSF
jgi:hypothetical protein